MLCRIADLAVEIPEAGGMAPRCRDYRIEEDLPPDIIIREEKYNRQRWQDIPAEYFEYVETGWLFYRRLFKFFGLMLHASAVEYKGEAYLFSGPSGIGKSTHTKIWQQILPESRIFNDDKPALRKVDGVWYAYGTPWCGKDGINVNRKVPLAGICFLKQGNENRIRRLEPWEAVPNLLSQTIRRFKDPERLDLMLSHLEKLVQEIPIYELVNRPELAAAQLSYETMRAGAQEAGL